MYKYCNNLLPSSLNNVFRTDAENHDFNTRNALNFEYFKKTNLTFVTNLLATRVLKLEITYQIMLKVVKT